MATPYSADPTLWLYTSLTAGSSHIITATSRLETILKANKIPFRALDVATDEKARMLWGRRSKGKKLPGLVKFGEIVGDLEQIEEWNEYGELKQQIGSVPSLGGSSTFTPSQPAEAALAAPTSAARSRSSSETRHISISEPKDVQTNPAASLKKDDTPLTMAMRQAGAEAAAKAGQKKTATPIPTSSTSATSKSEESRSDITDTTAPLTGPKLNPSSSDPSSSTEITAAKTPAQLATEGAKRTSIDKIAGQKELDNSAPVDSEFLSPSSPANATATQPQAGAEPSNEEQVLSMRRQSSIVQTKSRLSTQVEPEEVKSATEAVTSPTDELEAERPPPTATRSHRGSSISAASKEEIAEIEKRNAIPEEVEEASSEDEKDTSATATGADEIAATDKGEKAVLGETKPQEQDAKEGDQAGLSVGD